MVPVIPLPTASLNLSAFNETAGFVSKLVTKSFKASLLFAFRSLARLQGPVYNSALLADQRPNSIRINLGS